MQLSYDEIIDVLDLKNIPTKRMGFSIKPIIYNVVDLNNTLKNLPDVKISVTIDEKIYKTNLKNIQTLIFTIESFFYTTIGFTQSHSYPLDDIDGFYKLIAGSYKSDNMILQSIDDYNYTSHNKCIYTIM